MQAVTKIADLTKFRQTDIGQIGDFYANYVTRDIPDLLANLANLAIFIQIMSRNAGSDENGRFDEISSNRHWGNWRFLCKLCHQRYP